MPPSRLMLLSSIPMDRTADTPSRLMLLPSMLTDRTADTEQCHQARWCCQCPACTWTEQLILSNVIKPADAAAQHAHGQNSWYRAMPPSRLILMPCTLTDFNSWYFVNRSGRISMQCHCNKVLTMLFYKRTIAKPRSCFYLTCISKKSLQADCVSSL